MGYWIARSKCSASESDGTISTIDSKQMHFATRKSSLDALAILDVRLKLQFGDPAALTKRMQTLWILKRAQQPSQSSRTALAFIDAGPGSAVELISQCGLAGYRRGHVQISPAFPNYVVVDGNVTSDDVLALLEYVRNTVEEKTGVQLQSHLRVW